MRRLLIGFLIASLALPPVAAAQRGGVFVDPDSPAGTEYAIPLEQARRQNSGSGETSPGGGGAARQPLFGVGLGRGGAGSGVDGGPRGDGAGGVGTGGEGGSGGAAADAAARDRRNADDRARLTAGEMGDERRGAVAGEAAAEGGSDELVSAAIGGGVLAVALLVGFGLRRVLRGE